jgi:hypothetical protein
MSYCLKSPPPKFQPQLRSIMAQESEVRFSSFYMENEKAVNLFEFKRNV